MLTDLTDIRQRPSGFTLTGIALALCLAASGSNAGLQFTPAPTPDAPAADTADADTGPSTAEQAAAASAAPLTPPAAQRSSAPPANNSRIEMRDTMQLRWEENVGGDRFDEFNGVVSRRSDLMTIAVGATMSQSSGRKDAWVVAMDSDGKTRWQRSLGGARDDEARAVVDLDDGSLIVVGTTSSVGKGGAAGLVARLSADGDVVWERAVDTDDADSLHAVTLLANGDIVVGGTSGNMAALLARFDTDGEVVWRKTFRSETPDTVRTLLTMANDDLLLVGDRTELFDSNAVLARMSSAGELKWHLSLGSGGNDILFDALVLREGDILAAGEKTDTQQALEGWLVRVSPAGELRWEKTLGGSGRDSLRSILALGDGSVVVAGISDAGNQQEHNAWLMRLSEDGELMRTQKLGAEFVDGFNALSPRSDGSFVAAGFNHSWHDEPANGYIAMMGAPVVRSATPTYNSNNPPVVFMPGEGKIFTEQATVEVLGNVIHNKPVTKLFVDGRPARVLHNGAFTMRMSVPLGTTELKVEAIDRDGAIGSALIQVTRVDAGKLTPADLAPLVDSIAFGNYHAVIIGNNNYGGDIPALQTAEKDARVLAQLLEHDYGFDVELLLNADRDAILDVLERKSRELRDDDNLLLYYAGHGYYDEDVDLGYWLPVDAELDSKQNWIRNSTITDSIKEMQAKHVLLVADSCFSGTLLRSVDVKRTGKFFEQMATRSARLVMTSGGIEPVLDGGGDGHSVFARSFLDKLRNGEQIVDGTSLFQAVREPVVMSSEQVPQYSNIRFIDSDGGDFLFVKKN